MVGFRVHLSHYSVKIRACSLIDKNCCPESKSLVHSKISYSICIQAKHKARETARALRAVGRECVWKRINAVENGEQVPNDILTHILKI